MNRRGQARAPPRGAGDWHSGASCATAQAGRSPGAGYADGAVFSFFQAWNPPATDSAFA